MPGNALSPQTERVLQLEIGQEVFSAKPLTHLKKTLRVHAPGRRFSAEPREGGDLIRRVA